MITAVSHVRAVQQLPKSNGIKPDNRLEFLQHKDVFFSAQSYRAQVTHFLAQPPQAPLMFGFYRQDKESLWGKLFPATERNFLLASPVHPASTPASIPVEPTFHVTKSTPPKQETPVTLADTPPPEAATPLVSFPQPGFHFTPPMITALKRANPFAAATSNNGIRSSFTPFKTPADATPPPVAIQIQELAGKLIAPQLFQPLELAFTRAGLKPESPTWVQHLPDTIAVIPQKNPQQAGFQQVGRPWLSMLLQQLAKWLAPVLGLKIKDQRLELPNGDSVGLDRSRWRDAHGRSANLYEAMKLPDGRWFKVYDVKDKQVIPFKEQKTLRQLLEGRIEKHEQEGRLRETAQPIPSSKPLTSPLQTSVTSTTSPLSL
jgi:hypothetical protein